jgi:hypothetical protein
MKKYIVLILAFIVVKTSWSQNTHLDNKYAVKVYNLTSYEELIKIKTSKDNPSVSIQNASKEFQIFHPTIAFQWLNKRKNFHEIELTNIKFRKIESEIDEIDHTAGTNQAIFASDLSAAYISLRYEYIFNLNKKDNKPYMASLGVGLNPYYIQNNYSTSVTTAFPISENHIGLKKFITPNKITKSKLPKFTILHRSSKSALTIETESNLFIKALNSGYFSTATIDEN